ncbi:MAG: glycosyltransferase, partial [Alcaligenaceae bacterium]
MRYLQHCFLYLSDARHHKYSYVPPMNLLIFIHSLHSGGAERVAVNLANHWVQKGWRVTVVTLTRSAQDFYQLDHGAQRIALDLAGHSTSTLAAVRNNLLRVRALRQVLKQVQPDVALAMMSTANILLALAAIGLPGVAAVGSERTYPPRIPLGRVWEPLRAHLYGRLRAVVALTEESATWLHGHTKSRHITVIPNAVAWPLPDQSPFLNAPVRIAGQLTLLAVGRLSEEKGFAELVKVFQRLAPDFANWQLIILGDGPGRIGLQAQIAAAGLSAQVKLSGRAGNV